MDVDLALNLLSNVVSLDGDGCAAIHEAHGVDTLVELMGSRNREIQENATFLLAYCCEYGTDRGDARRRGSKAEDTDENGGGKAATAASAQPLVDASNGQQLLHTSSMSSSSSVLSSSSSVMNAAPIGVLACASPGKVLRARERKRHGDAMRSLLRQERSGALTGLVWMIDHRGKFIRANARRCLEALRTSSGDTLVPFIEQGLVALLHRITGSKHAEAAQYAREFLGWLKREVQGPALHVLLRTLNMEGNEEMRGNIAIAFVHLCFEADHIRAAFINDGGLDSTLSMLLDGKGRGVGLEFLYALQPLIQAQQAAVEAEEKEATELKEEAKEGAKKEAKSSAETKMLKLLNSKLGEGGGVVKGGEGGGGGGCGARGRGLRAVSERLRRGGRRRQC